MNAIPTLTPTAKRHGVPRSTVRLISQAFGTECDLQRSMIAEAAYYLAERRRFAPDHELDDWLAAEAEIKQLWARAREEAPLPCCADY
jgi:hypothetical protein